MKVATIALLFLLVACGSKDDISGENALFHQVEKTQVGSSADQWIEMKNMMGKWERTGLIFGYLDDYDECTKAIAGLKKVNYKREYRCISAN